MSFTWNVEEMKLRGAKCKMHIGDERIYEEDRTTSREDKIAFIDSMTNGNLTYLLDLIKRFKEDAPKMPRGEFGEIKANAINAWIASNDPKRKLCAFKHAMGLFSIIGCRRYIQYDDKGDYDHYEDLVDEVFHRQLKRCEEQENQYFREHDKQWVMMKTVAEKMDKHGTSFGVQVCVGAYNRLTIAHPDGHRRGERELTIEEMENLLAKYEKLEALIEQETADTYIVY